MASGFYYSTSLGIARRPRPSEQAAPAAYSPGESGPSEDALRIIEASRQRDAQRQENNARSPRVADPRFARITDNVAPSRPCEFKPVMTDDDTAALQDNGRLLLKIGTNVNQMARLLNGASHQTELVRLEVLTDVSNSIVRTRNVIRSIVRNTRRGWAADEP